MPSENYRISVLLEDDAHDDFNRVAKEGANLKATLFAAQILSTFARLKPEHALDAISCIPKDFFKRRVGRPALDAQKPATGQA